MSEFANLGNSCFCLDASAHKTMDNLKEVINTSMFGIAQCKQNWDCAWQILMAITVHDIDPAMWAFCESPFPLVANENDDNHFIDWQAAFNSAWYAVGDQ